MRLKKAFLILLLSTISLFASPNGSWTDQEIIINVNRDLLQHDTHLLKNQATLKRLYNSRQNRPLWLTNRGIKGKRVKQLLSLIQRDVTLNPRGNIHKKSKIIKKVLARHHTKESIVLLELQLTTLYLDFLKHTIYGEIDWKAFDAYLKSLEEKNIEANWVHEYPKYFNLPALLSQEDIAQTIRQITPQGYHYKKLSSALYKLYKIKWRGGWKKLPHFKSLKKGQSSSIVPKLRQRLMISGDYRACSTKASSKLFDTCLEKAVKRFQIRHSTTADGVVGSGTQKLLNISVNTKIKKLLLNIDRIKWLPRNQEKRYIVVNIPEYILHLYEYGREIKRHRVIVGDPEHPTPIFSDKLSYITLNPYWKLPPGIIKKEVVPAMIKNRNYIKKHGLEAHKTWEEDSPIVSLKKIKWSKYLKDGVKFPYRLMQPPGPKNALGQIKFKFPNKFSVYLHDTPGRYLFKKSKRAFSHGCIRLDKPFSLLGSLAKVEPHIKAREIKSILKSKKKKEIDLTKDIPINLVYITTWVDKYNRLIFGDDIYSYDKHQKRFIR